MTWQAIKFLYDFKKVQRTEDGIVWFDNDAKSMYTVIEAGQESTVKDLSKQWSSIPSMRLYLIEKGYMEKQSRNYYFLTHSGFHYYQTLFSSFLAFLTNSIGVPIITSILTTLVSLKLFGTI